VTFADDAAVGFLGVIVGGVEVGDFVFAHEAAFLRAAFFHPRKAPLGAAPGCADRLAIDEHENRIGV
tara:strand:+ start:1711 stop:1911 length:201 start_codon:yes stop_codon:yes gene_type:complete